MTQYVFAYYGEPSFDSPEAGSAYQDKWRAWMGGLGDAIVDPGIPIKPSKTVTSDSVADSPVEGRLSGILVVQAVSVEAAIELALASQHLEYGTIDVAEAFDMAMM
jgi:hypothetical protein